MAYESVDPVGFVDHGPLDRVVADIQVRRERQWWLVVTVQPGQLASLAADANRFASSNVSTPSRIINSTGYRNCHTASGSPSSAVLFLWSGGPYLK